MSEIYFRQKPYAVTYSDFHTGEIKKVTRRPPPKLHEALPKDMVKLTQSKGQTWEQGEEYKVKHISTRAPNTLQIMDEEGATTFIAHFDIESVDKKAFRNVHDLDLVEKNEYLLWP